MKKKYKKLVDQYEGKHPLYEEFTEYCKNEVYLFIKELGLEDLLDQVAFRTKTVSSFQKKIQDILCLSHVKDYRDLSGVRAIFCVDSAISSFWNHLVGDRKIRSLECSGFNKVVRNPGFKGQFVTLKLSQEEIIKYPELKKFEGCLCELQVTDTLQNAWARIYHQTLYKHKKMLEDNFPEEVELLEKRYQDMISGPLREVSDNINYLHEVGTNLLEGHKFFNADISEEVRECVSLNQFWELLNKFEKHLRVFGPKFSDNEAVIVALESILQQLKRLSEEENDKFREWQRNDAIKKIASISIHLFYYDPQKICDFLEIFIQQYPSHHQIIIENMKLLTCYDRKELSKISYSKQLILSRWISLAWSQNKPAIKVWLALLNQLLKMELSGTSWSDVDLLSIQRGILPYHLQLEEIRSICLHTLLSIMKEEETAAERVNLIRLILQTLRPSYFHEQIEPAHRKMYENELSAVVSYFSDNFDGMTLQELIVFEVEGLEIGYWFEKCKLDANSLYDFLSRKFQAKDYLAVRVFVGHDRHRVIKEEEQTSRLSGLVSELCSDNWGYWKEKICIASSLLTDLGHGEFESLEEFLEILTVMKPELAIELLQHHIVDLGWFSSNLMSPLYQSDFQEEVITLLKDYIRAKTEIEAVVQGIARITLAPHEVVALLLETVIEAGDVHSVFVLVCSLQRISKNWDENSIKSMFFRGIEFLSVQRDFRWVEQVLYEKNPLFESFVSEDFKKILSLIVKADFASSGVDYVLSKVGAKNPAEVLQFFIDRREASKKYSSISLWPSNLIKTKEILSSLTLLEMNSFYSLLKASEELSHENFIFQLLPRLMNHSAVSVSEFLDSINANDEDLELCLKILRQYPDDPNAFANYKKIICRFELHRDQIDEICLQLIFVSETIGREGRLTALQSRKALIDSWAHEAEESSSIKKFLKRCVPAIETAIADEQALVSRNLFIDTAVYKDSIKKSEKADV